LGYQKEVENENNEHTCWNAGNIITVRKKTHPHNYQHYETFITKGS